MHEEPYIIIGNKYLETVTPLIAAAKQSICIIVFYWKLQPSRKNYAGDVLLRELQRAASRGVRVRAIVASEVLRQQLQFAGVEAKVLYADRLVHAKMMLLDEQVAVIGSHNYTQSAFTKNLEISVVVKFAAKENDLSKYFSGLWGI